VRKHFQANSDDVSFDATVRVIGRWLTTLACAIGTANYFDAWLAAMRLRMALDRGEWLAGLMSSESRLLALTRLNGIQSIAAPILALAPMPSRHEIRNTRTSDAHQGRRTLEHLERQWWHSVQQQLNTVKEDGYGDAGESGGSHDDHVAEQTQYSNPRRQ
jgi:hypothetical protein